VCVCVTRLWDLSAWVWVCDRDVVPFSMGLGVLHGCGTCWHGCGWVPGLWDLLAWVWQCYMVVVPVGKDVGGFQGCETWLHACVCEQCDKAVGPVYMCVGV